MAGLALTPQDLALLFEFLDRLTAARLSRTCKFVYEVFRQALLREPNEIAFNFYFAKLYNHKIVPDDDDEVKQDTEAVICFNPTRERLRRVDVTIEISDTPRIFALIVESSNLISMGRKENGNFVVSTTCDTPSETLFTSFQNFQATFADKTNSAQLGSVVRDRCFVEEIYPSPEKKR